MDDKRFDLKSRSARMSWALLAVTLTVAAVIPFTVFTTLKVVIIGLWALQRVVALALADSLIALVWHCYDALKANWKE